MSSKIVFFHKKYYFHIKFDGRKIVTRYYRLESDRYLSWGIMLRFTAVSNLEVDFLMI